MEMATITALTGPIRFRELTNYRLSPIESLHGRFSVPVFTFEHDTKKHRTMARTIPVELFAIIEVARRPRLTSVKID